MKVNNKQIIINDNNRQKQNESIKNNLQMANIHVFYRQNISRLLQKKVNIIPAYVALRYFVVGILHTLNISD